MIYYVKTRMPSLSVLPLHLVDQVLLFVLDLPENLLVLVVQKCHDLLEHPIDGKMKIQFKD